MPEDKEAPVYTAERILSKRIRKGKAEYYIKWKGWAAKWNTWEPERHILDKLLIADFNNRTRKSQKSKSLVRKSITKPSANTRVTRTRHLRSSSLSNPSESAPPSPATNDEDSLLKEKLDDEQADVHKSRSNSSDEATALAMEKPILDESIREYLWQPTKVSTATTSITEVTDQTGVTVLIRELNDMPISTDNRTARFLGYGSGGRGGRH